MNGGQTSVESPQFASVLGAFTTENGSCVEDTLHTHSLENESSFTPELVGMEELTIVTSNGEVSSRLASRILTGDISSIADSKTLHLNPEDLLQQNCGIEEQPLSFKTTSILSHAGKSNKWRDITEGRHIKKTLFTVPKPDTSNQNQIPSNVNTSDLSNVINLSSNKLPSQSMNNTAVEQPNVGPCSCFICGQRLVDPTERFSYMITQKLFSMKISLLQLLSDIVNQTVITNTDSIDLCTKCSELMNDVDITYKYLNDLKEEITKLFTINKRPKLTFHILPKPLSVIPKTYFYKKSKEVNLSELAYTRPRRGRGSKKNTLMKEKKNDQIPENEKPVKKKGGRPRKPFQCHICKRKFLTQSMCDRHLFKEHNETLNDSRIPLPNLQSVNTTNAQLSISSVQKVKQENLEEEKEGNEKFDRKAEIFSLLQQSTSLPAVSKFNSVDCLNAGLQSTGRPIQPKPQTVVHTGVDGSLMFYMNPTTSEASPTLIKVSPGYLNLKTGAHTCELCQKTFLDDKGYKMHKIAAHGVRKRKMEYEETLNESILQGEDKKDSIHKFWQCDLCNVMFSSKKLLSDHKKISHNSFFKLNLSKEVKRDKIYRCENCQQMFNYKYEMESHKESHLPFNKVGPHEFVCCLCGLKVASKAALKIHFHRFHSKEEETKAFLCAECGYMAATKKAFSDHLRVHNDNPGEKKECHLCQKEMLPSSYKIHMLRMHGEAKYPCETCGQRFTVRSDLMKHLNTIHSSIRPYDCLLCGEKFVTSEALRYHKNKVHSTVFHFCEICGKSYKWKGELRTHVNRCHSESKTRYQCALCPRNYADRRKLYHHMANKHSSHKDVTTIQKHCQEKGSVLKVDQTEISSSVGYEPQGSLIGSPETVMASIACSSAPSEVHLVTGEGNHISSLHGYEPTQQTSLTTLHSHVPSLHQPDHHHHHHHHHHHTEFSHLHDDTSTTTHFTHTDIHSATSQTLLTHESVGASLVPFETKGHTLTTTDVQSIYLVSDMQSSMEDKTTVTT